MNRLKTTFWCREFWKKKKRKKKQTCRKKTLSLQLSGALSGVCFLQWAAVSKMTQHMTMTLTLVHRKIQVATIIINCIQLKQDIWVLTWGKWAGISILFVKSKIYEHRIWWKLKSFSCCNLTWFLQVRYSSLQLEDLQDWEGFTRTSIHIPQIHKFSDSPIPLSNFKTWLLL